MIAKSQVGKVGGKKYWEWYGFKSRVEWCCVFVSYVELNITYKGGTPNHAATYLKQKYNCPIITGVNLPMLLELVMMRNQENNLDMMVEKITQSGKEGIVAL